MARVFRLLMTTSGRSTKFSPTSNISPSRRDGTREPGSASGLSKDIREKTSRRGRSARRGYGKSNGRAGSSLLHKSDSTPSIPSTKSTNMWTEDKKEVPDGKSSPSTSPIIFSPGLLRHVSGTSTSQGSEPSSEPPLRLSQSQPPRVKEAHPSGLPNSPNSASGVKSNIDALVERVRANAMATNRPHTPGSHIDWAGDDDDSLPDLDDWGIQSPPTTSHNPISPIIVDGLVPLPEYAVTLPSTEAHDGSLAKIPTRGSSPQDQQWKEKELAEPESSAARKEASAAIAGQLGVDPESLDQTSLDPSLLPKPASLMQQVGNHPGNPLVNGSRKQPRPRFRNTNVRNHKMIAVMPSNLRSGARGQIQSSEVVGISENGKGLAASIHAPRKETASTSSEPELGGLNTPGHRCGASASGRVPANKTRTPRDSLSTSRGDPTRFHSRSVNHLSSFSQPAEQSVHSAPHTGRSAENHPRVQLSPGANGSSRLSHRRPVLTGDALTKLARTLSPSTQPLPSR